MEILRVEHVSRIYGKGETEVRALDDVSFTVEKGEMTAVVGRSGSGKSTLLHLIGGVDRPDGGKIFVEGQEVYHRSQKEMAIFRRRKVGLIYQFYNLIPVLNVWKISRFLCGWTDRRSIRIIWNVFLIFWDFPTGRSICQSSFPADSSSGFPSDGPSFMRRRCYWPMSPRGILTKGTVRKSWNF